MAPRERPLSCGECNTGVSKGKGGREPSQTPCRLSGLLIVGTFLNTEGSLRSRKYFEKCIVKEKISTAFGQEILF